MLRLRPLAIAGTLNSIPALPLAYDGFGWDVNLQVNGDANVVAGELNNDGGNWDNDQPNAANGNNA